MKITITIPLEYIVVFCQNSRNPNRIVLMGTVYSASLGFRFIGGCGWFIMGATVSNLSDLATSPYLIKLVGQESVHSSNEYWNRLLSFHLQTPLTKFVNY